ncbi:histidine kinase dimerization/phospho-acceptor domain-containing protein [Lachnotalea glycerini]|uniref:histidine kinase dimerization/phospho-acceptor domain-containing protein n=1 Tax=Lachnotalea glycerini TaxID=1763509 RepID=UPI001FA8FB44|nr:histidine kinase dimerization/phospho-acceptor domain-containing protein [Lachnotalea glycerini]
MSSNKLSTRNISIGLKIGMSLITMTFLTIIYIVTKKYWLLLAILSYTFVLFSFFLFTIYLLNKKVILFTSEICRMLDAMMSGLVRPQISAEEETLLSRVYYRLIRLYEIMYESRQSVINDKLALQELISDVSHQVRTPISNLKIMNDTLLNKQLTTEKQNELLQAMDSQIKKIEFLMQSLVKTSRLEMGMISLTEKKIIYLIH